MILVLSNDSVNFEHIHGWCFIRRKTDFFVGASSEKVEELVLSVIKKHSALSEKTENEKRKEKDKEEKKRKDRIALQKKVQC